MLPTSKSPVVASMEGAFTGPWQLNAAYADPEKVENAMRRAAVNLPILGVNCNGIVMLLVRRDCGVKRSIARFYLPVPPRDAS